MAVKQKGLLIDITRCIGCGECSKNCKSVNQLPAEQEERLAPDTWTTLTKMSDETYVRNLCRHCVEPACASACPVAALYKSKDGAVIYDKDICLGCRYCMTACPFQIPTFEWHSNSPRIRKCILCEPRIREGKSTGCAEACPTEATVFGDRDTLVQMAEARLAAEPDRYHNHIYGKQEVGGTSVMFMSKVPFDQLGFDTSVAMTPLPELTFQVLKHVPNIVLLGAGFLGGTYWLLKRREEVKKAEGKEGHNDK